MAEGEAPFLSAVKCSHVRVAEILLRIGARVDCPRRPQDDGLHYVLEKASLEQHFRALVQHAARGDLPNQEGVTAAQIMSRKRSPSFRKMAAELAAW